MGGSTFAIGLVPNYNSIGIAAPIILLLLRLLQGLALGGEYGGAATYVAEHSPEGQRGYFTSWIQTTATIGFFISILVILCTRLGLGEQVFNDWGWRIPFLLSGILVILSYYIRRELDESPLFTKLKAEGKLSVNPIKESFGNKENLKLVLIALFGATAGQGCVWYTGQFYAQIFIRDILKIEFVTANTIIAIAALLATPFFVYFGRLSDTLGRKKIILGGMLLAAVSYLPIYKAMHYVGTPDKTTVVASAFVSETTESAAPSTHTLKIDKDTRTFADGFSETTITTTHNTEKAPAPEIKSSITPPLSVSALLVLLVFVQVLFVTMVYGPIAAFLVELFPTRIRYTSMSLPYHIGNGIFGGLTPFIATAMVASTNNIYAGLYYPIGVALITVVVGYWFIKEKQETI